MALVRIAKDWDWPDILRQTPGGAGVWGAVRFTLEEVAECDLLLVLNNRLRHDVRTRCPEHMVWALMQEPYHRGFTDWMVERQEAFHRVFSHHVPPGGAHYVIAQPATPWHVNRTFDQLTTMAVPEKVHSLSWVVGRCTSLPGHRQRLAFLKIIMERGDIPISLFGRAVQPIDDKWDGLAPFHFSLAVENTVTNDYWTEKLADCFLSWTVPLYHGCPNLLKYFPADSYIPIDIGKPGEALAIIDRVVAGGVHEWRRRLPALEEARRRVLYEYQLFPFIAGQLGADGAGTGDYVSVTVPRYRRSLKAMCWRRYRKISRLARRLLGDGFPLPRTGR